MTITAIAQLVATYGPTILPLVEKLIADIEAGKGNQQVTSADVAELIRLAGLTSASLYARAGVALPSAT
jgi:hypothetical protein